MVQFQATADLSKGKCLLYPLAMVLVGHQRIWRRGELLTTVAGYNRLLGSSASTHID